MQGLVPKTGHAPFSQQQTESYFTLLSYGGGVWWQGQVLA